MYIFISSPATYI